MRLFGLEVEAAERVRGMRFVSGLGRTAGGCGDGGVCVGLAAGFWCLSV